MTFIAFLLHPWARLVRSLDFIPRSLADDLLVYAIGTGHQRLVEKAYAATFAYLHCLGARHQAIRQSMLLETGLLTLLSTVFATALGALIALPLAGMLLKLPAGDLWWLGALVAGAVSSLALLAGLLPTLRALRLNPAMLLREG
jgi:predicted lysophospholipase L1 biosynthesis ABC-type transport system permease subunit